MTVDIGEMPEHAKGSLLVQDRSYEVRYQQEPCMWFSSGPSLGPVHERTGDDAVDTVERHTNVAGPTTKPYLRKSYSGTATSECNSPRARKIVILGLPADFDRRGRVSFGGAQHVIGEIRLPQRPDSGGAPEPGLLATGR